MEPIKVVDLFAGPGGLGEGFASYPYYNSARRFRVGLSIEKDPVAAQTLALRSFTRQFRKNCIPDEYYDLLADVDRPLTDRLNELYAAFPSQYRQAADEVWCSELGRQDKTELRRRIRKAIYRNKNWVLIGGPPCQAYSLAGRSRNRGVADYDPDKDTRQFLYKEYLQVIADHKPAIFVMENVKGLLSATVRNKKILDQILSDLRNPSRLRKETNGRIRKSEDEYRICSIVTLSADDDELSLDDFVVKMEQFGVPQARHRIILLGIRNDIASKTTAKILAQEERLNSTEETIGGLPRRLRSGLSKGSDSCESWRKRIEAFGRRRWAKKAFYDGHYHLLDKIQQTVRTLTQPKHKRGGEYINTPASAQVLQDWYLDKNLDGTFNHSSRGHIESDLERYFFSACFAKVEHRSPTLSDFPEILLPDHSNVEHALSGSNFADRFRVQMAHRPSTTITCHIAKDGHYYIHYDPSQCRSLTVREAARLQTFPDNYFFCGPRTKQYIQVGNAVPPYLAHQIAEIVFAILHEAKSK